MFNTILNSRQSGNDDAKLKDHLGHAMTSLTLLRNDGAITELQYRQLVQELLTVYANARISLYLQDAILQSFKRLVDRS